MEAEGCLRIRGKLDALCTLEIGVENKSIQIDMLQQDHADIRTALRVGRRKRRRVRIIDFAVPSLGIPFFEQGDRFCSGGPRALLRLSAHLFNGKTRRSPLPSCAGAGPLTRGPSRPYI